MGLCLVVWDLLINTSMFSNHVFLKNNPNSKQNTLNDSQYEDALEKEEKTSKHSQSNFLFTSFLKHPLHTIKL